MAVSAVLMQSVRVVKSPISTGRSLVAVTSRLAPGKCILEELPYAYALCDNKKGLFCEFCLKKSSTLKKCTGCKYLSYCNKSCQKGDWARCHKQDCKTLKIVHPRPPDLHRAQLLSQIIRKQRQSPPCTQYDEDSFPTTVDQLECHHNKLSETRRDEFESILSVLKRTFADDVLPEESRLLKMFEATVCNSFSMFDNDLIGVAIGIYLRASMVNHSCDPNCQVVFDERKLQLRTVKDVKEGEECTISYVDPMDPAKERQTQLEEKYHFTCKCVKCVEEINPDDVLGEELRGRLKKSWEQIQDALKSQYWTKVLQLCEPYLKLMDSSNGLLDNHYLLVRLRQGAIKACVHIQAWEKSVEMAQLNIKSLRYHYGPFSAILGIHLYGMGNMLFEMGRLQEARKYVTEAKIVLEVSHGIQHSLMKTTSLQKLLSRFPVPGEENVKPVKMECRERVGLEGGKLQLDSFGIELEIPPGAIDSEAPQYISLRVLTNTPNLGSSKAEMSACFGVQCLAPDDLVLKLPVTYTIPHCAVITRHSSVEAVLYAGEGEYLPGVVVKERSMLSRSGIPSCTITKDALKLKMNHFSWIMIKFLFRDFFFPQKRMCCLPFKEKILALQKTPVILHAHLYDDIKGNSELVKSQEVEQEFIPAHVELQVDIQSAEGDLKMTCYVNETAIGRPAVVPFDKLMSGARICGPLQLDFTKQSDIVAVSLKVGQNENLQVEFLFRLDFSTPHTRKGASPQNQERSSQTLQTSHRSIENISGRQEDFDDKLTTIARKVACRNELDKLGKALGFEPEDIQRYVDTKSESYMGTLYMLRAWRKKQTEATECEALKRVLMKADQNSLAFELFSNS